MQVNEFTAQKQQAATQAQSIGESIQQIGQESAALSAQMQSLRSSISSLASEIAYDEEGKAYCPNEAAIAALEQQVNSITKNIENLSKQIEQATKDLAKVKDEKTRAELQEQLKDIEIKLEEETKSFAEAMGMDPDTLEYNITGLGVFTGLEIMDPELLPEEIDNLGTVFKTSGGYYISTDIEEDGNQVKIYDKEGKEISKMWGDPHVDENQDGVDDWHFGDDSYFLLPDGTEILFNTQEIQEGEHAGAHVTRGLQIRDGSQLAKIGLDLDDETLVETAITRNDDTESNFDKLGDRANGAGVFAYSLDANNGKGGWAIHHDGKFYDVADESWDSYLQNKDFNDQIEGGPLEIDIDSEDAVQEFLDKLDNIGRNLSGIQEDLSMVSLRIAQASKPAPKPSPQPQPQPAPEPQPVEPPIEEPVGPTLGELLAERILAGDIEAEEIVRLYKEDYRSFEKHVASLDEDSKVKIAEAIVQQARAVQSRTDLSASDKEKIIGDLIFIVQRMDLKTPISLSGLLGNSSVVESFEEFGNSVLNPDIANSFLLDTYSQNYRAIEKDLRDNNYDQEFFTQVSDGLFTRIENEPDQKITEGLDYYRKRIQGLAT
jgi:uncharacterized protein YukE